MESNIEKHSKSSKEKKNKYSYKGAQQKSLKLLSQYWRNYQFGSDLFFILGTPILFSLTLYPLVCVGKGISTICVGEKNGKIAF